MQLSAGQDLVVETLGVEGAEHAHVTVGKGDVEQRLVTHALRHLGIAALRPERL